MESIKVSGMSCGHCVASVTKTLEEMNNVSNVKIDLASGVVQYDTQGEVSIDAIKNAISKIGFTPEG
jgi:copper chaperone CopZ